MQTQDRQSVQIGAGGTGQIRLTPGGTFTYIVGQVSLNRNPAPLGATCFVRLNGADVTPVIASGDTAAGEPFVWVYPGSVLTVEFVGYAPGQTLSTLMLYTKEQT